MGCVFYNAPSKLHPIDFLSFKIKRFKLESVYLFDDIQPELYNLLN